MFTRIYALAVCFAAMLCIAIMSGIGLYDLVQISFPRFALSAWQLNQLETGAGPMGSYSYLENSGFHGTGMAAAESLDRRPALPTPTPEELKQQRARYVATLIKNERHNAIRSLLQVSIYLLVSSILFAIHWRLARRLDTAEGSG